VQAVLAHPEPTNIGELQTILGTVNFYRRFLPAAARTLKLLTDLLVGGPKGTEPVSLAEPQRAAFLAAKNALAAATCLAHPSQGFQLSLMVDACADHIGGALQQRRRPADPWQLLGFTSDIQHIAGTDNVVADTLSRPPGGATAGSGSESPPRGPDCADRGGKVKTKLSTSSGGLRSPVEALPEVNAVRATTCGRRLRRPRRPPGSVPAYTAGGFFYITSDREAGGRRRGAPQQGRGRMGQELPAV
jgi:hypothetical protein